MKKLFLLLLIACGAINAIASTSITTPSVSGHWTLAGSPYLVYNNVQIDSAQSLKIDAGVQVLFQGTYSFVVFGVLHAVGTATQSINFTIGDTTGWSTDIIGTQGGWHGLNIAAYGGTAPDTSTIRYCNVSRTKFCNADYFIPVNTLSVSRNILIENCNFFDNKTNDDASIFMFTTQSPFELSNCSFYNNVCDKAMIFFTAFANCHNNKFYNNKVLTDVIYMSLTDFLFKDNEIYNNTETGGVSGCSPLHMANCTNVAVYGNSIHHNLSYGESGVICEGGGFIDIAGNKICNNQCISSGVGCGVVDGGGGAMLTCNGCTPGSYFYTLRNNVIANNTCYFEGGAIKIYRASALIANNQIVHNVSDGGGSIYLFEESTDSLVIKNNIFYKNINMPIEDSNFESINGFFDAGSIIEYDHNWSSQAYYQDMGSIVGLGTVTGDTATNLTGSWPGLVAPTLTAGASENALTANFGLLSTSPCVDKGDTTGAWPDSVDYAHAARIYHSIIDIGAYEYAPAPPPVDTTTDTTHHTTGIVNTMTPAGNMIVYPNPAKNNITISTPYANGVIELQDVSGRQVAEVQVVNTLTVLDIHNLSSGVYFITWHDSRDAKTTRKIAVE